MNQFETVSLPDHSCNECDNDIFSVLENNPNRNNEFRRFIDAHANKDLLKLFDNITILYIKHIPEDIKKILLDT